MAPVAGRPFLEHQLDYWIHQGVRRFILSVGYRYEAIESHFGASYNGAAVEYAVEETPLGTGGGFLLAAERLGSDEPFLLLNGDTYFAAELEALSDVARRHDADWCLSLFRTEERDRYQEITVAPDGRITSLEASSAGRTRLASGGVYWVNPRALAGRFPPGAKVSLETEILPAALAAGQGLYGVEFSGTFIDIGVPADFARAQTLLASDARSPR
jgi:D-glycero-alpha-D-manno-heptose 1-phosphate guanylyltransferase